MPVDATTIENLDTSQYENIPIPELGEMTIVQLRQKLIEMRALLQGLRNLFDFKMHRLTDKERREFAARAAFRDGEFEAFHSTLDGADLKPEFVADLADKDEGADPTLLETPLLRARALAYVLIYPIVEQFLEQASDIKDAAIKSGYLSKLLIREMNAILKLMAKNNPPLRAVMAKAIDYGRSLIPKKPKEGF